MNKLRIRPEVRQAIEAALGQTIPQPTDPTFAAFLKSLTTEHPELAQQLRQGLEVEGLSSPSTPSALKDQIRMGQARERNKNLLRALFQRQQWQGKWVPDKRKLLIFGLLAACLGAGVFILTLSRPSQKAQTPSAVGMVGSTLNHPTTSPATVSTPNNPTSLAAAPTVPTSVPQSPQTIAPQPSSLTPATPAPTAPNLPPAPTPVYTSALPSGGSFMTTAQLAQPDALVYERKPTPQTASSSPDQNFTVGTSPTTAPSGRTDPLMFSAPAQAGQGTMLAKAADKQQSKALIYEGKSATVPLLMDQTKAPAQTAGTQATQQATVYEGKPTESSPLSNLANPPVSANTKNESTVYTRSTQTNPLTVAAKAASTQTPPQVAQTQQAPDSKSFVAYQRQGGEASSVVYEAPAKEAAKPVSREQTERKNPSSMIYDAPTKETAKPVIPEQPKSGATGMFKNAVSSQPMLAYQRPQEAKTGTPANTSPTDKLSDTGLKTVYQRPTPPVPPANSPTPISSDPVTAIPAKPSSTFTPGQQIQAKLVTAVLAVEKGSVPVLAESEGALWIGVASLNEAKRVEIGFNQVVRGGQATPIQALAFDEQGVEGLQATIEEQAPSLASDMLRAAVSGVSTYVQGLAQAGNTTVLPGGGAVQSKEAPPLGITLLGEVGKLFALPQNQATVVRLAKVDKDTPIQIVVGIGEKSGQP